MTATQPGSDSKISRRGVMRKATAVGVGSAATIGGAHRMGVSPVGSASAIAPLVLAGYAGAAGLGYLMYKNAEKATGQQRDYSGYTGYDALQLSVYEDGIEAKSVDERVMTSIENNLQNSENVGLAKGKAALVTALNNGATEQEANNQMTAVVNDYYSTIQENIVTHYKAQQAKMKSMADNSVLHPEGGGNDAFRAWTDGGRHENVIEIADGPGLAPNGSTTVTLLNGDELSIPKYQYKIIDGFGDPKTLQTEWKKEFMRNGSRHPTFGFRDPDSGDITKYAFFRVYDAFDKAVTARDNVNGNLVGLASDLYSAYEPGEIPTEDILDPVTAATELGQNTGLSSRQAAAGMMGIPTSAGFSLRLELQTDSGDKYAVDAEIYTNAQPEDSDGNPGGFKIGKEYDPANFDAPIFVSYQYIDEETGEESTDFTQILNPFKVLEATDSEGNNVDEVTPDSDINQTADVDKIEEELAQIRNRQQELLETQPEPPSGGVGAGFFGSNTPSTGAIAAFVGVLGVLYAVAQGGTN